MLVIATFILSLIPFSGQTGSSQPKSFERAKTELVSTQSRSYKKTAPYSDLSLKSYSNSLNESVSVIQKLSRHHSQLVKTLLLIPPQTDFNITLKTLRLFKTIPSSSDESSSILS